MQRVQIKVIRAYINYCAAFNHCARQDLSRFASFKDYISDAEEISEEKQIVLDPVKVGSFIKDTFGILSDLNCVGYLLYRIWSRAIKTLNTLFLLAFSSNHLIYVALKCGFSAIPFTFSVSK